AGWRAMPHPVEHRRPEQAVEVDDVLADEVVHLGPAARLEEGPEVQAFALAQLVEAGEVPDRGIDPDVQVLAGMARDLEPEVGRIAGDVPGAQPALGVQPLTKLGLDPAGRDVAG